jgi:hypothetical protein
MESGGLEGGRCGDTVSFLCQANSVFMGGISAGRGGR